MILQQIDASEQPSLRAWSTLPGLAPSSTDAASEGRVVLLRTGEPWDYIVGVGCNDGQLLRLVLVFKNAVPLWQSAETWPDGHLSREAWALLRQLVIIHNPGLPAVLDRLDEFDRGLISSI
jgi:hypothetical protein